MEENGFFNDTLNVYYLRLCEIRYLMVENKSDNEKGNLFDLYALSHKQDYFLVTICPTPYNRK